MQIFKVIFALLEYKSIKFYHYSDYNSGFDRDGHVGKFERCCQKVHVKYVKQLSDRLARILTECLNSYIFGKSHKFACQ